MAGAPTANQSERELKTTRALNTVATIGAGHALYAMTPEKKREAARERLLKLTPEKSRPRARKVLATLKQPELGGNLTRAGKVVAGGWLALHSAELVGDVMARRSINNQLAQVQAQKNKGSVGSVKKNDQSMISKADGFISGNGHGKSLVVKATKADDTAMKLGVAGTLASAGPLGASRSYAQTSRRSAEDAAKYKELKNRATKSKLEASKLMRTATDPDLYLRAQAQRRNMFNLALRSLDSRQKATETAKKYAAKSAKSLRLGRNMLVGSTGLSLASLASSSVGNKKVNKSASRNENRTSLKDRAAVTPLSAGAAASAGLGGYMLGNQARWMNNHAKNQTANAMAEKVKLKNAKGLTDAYKHAGNVNLHEAHAAKYLRHRNNAIAGGSALIGLSLLAGRADMKKKRAKSAVGKSDRRQDIRGFSTTKNQDRVMLGAATASGGVIGGTAGMFVRPQERTVYTPIKNRAKEKYGGRPGGNTKAEFDKIIQQNKIKPSARVRATLLGRRLSPHRYTIAGGVLGAAGLNNVERANQKISLGKAYDGRDLSHLTTGERLKNNAAVIAPIGVTAALSGLSINRGSKAADARAISRYATDVANSTPGGSSRFIQEKYRQLGLNEAYRQHKLNRSSKRYLGAAALAAVGGLANNTRIAGKRHKKYEEKNGRAPVMKSLVEIAKTDRQRRIGVGVAAAGGVAGVAGHLPLNAVKEQMGREQQMYNTYRATHPDIINARTHEEDMRSLRRDFKNLKRLRGAGLAAVAGGSALAAASGRKKVSKAYRRFDPEADRQRRLGLYAGTGVGASILTGGLASRHYTRDVYGAGTPSSTGKTSTPGKSLRGIAFKPGMGTKRLSHSKAGTALTLASLISGAGGVKSYTHGTSVRNNTWT